MPPGTAVISTVSGFSDAIDGTATSGTASSCIGAMVLVAEDNPVNIEIALVYLDELGCKVEIAETGHHAVRLFKSRSFDAVLMDCQMPEMDGLVATGIIREHELRSNLPRVPIIAVTANACEDDRARCRAAGMDDFLTKPYSEARLAAVLAPWIPRHRTERASRVTIANRPSGNVADTANAVEGERGFAAAATSRQRPPIDRGAPYVQPAGVRALVQEFGFEMAEELLSIFVQECAKSLLQLEGCLANGDKVGLKSAAHKVVGGASMIHAAGLADLARNIETTCDRHEGFNGLDAARLHDAVGEVVAVFGTLTDRNSLERYMSAGNPLAFHA